MKTHDPHINHLITKYLDKSITRDECAELYKNLSNDKTKLSYFIEIKDLWLYSTALWRSAITTQQALEKLKARIKKHQALSRFKKTIYYGSQIAAVIIVAIIFLTTTTTTEYKRHILLTTSQKAKITLSDGTIVWLNKNSKLVYPEKFKSTERNVFLEGEAYFEVVKNKNRPFFVRSNSQEIKVLGTSFNIKDRPEDNYVETTLLSGAISLRPATDSIPIILAPNERIRFNKLTQSAQKDTVLAREHIVWATEEMAFNNDPLTNVLSYLENKYNLQIICPSEISDTLHVTLVVRNETQEEILKEISHITHLQYTIYEDSVYFSPAKRLNKPATQ